MVGVRAGLVFLTVLADVRVVALGFLAVFFRAGVACPLTFVVVMFDGVCVAMVASLG